MGRIRDFFGHPIIQMALAVGASILVLAYFSKRVLAEPLGDLELALPPFMAVLHEAVAHFRKDAWYSRTVVGIAAVLVATVLVIALNA